MGVWVDLFVGPKDGRAFDRAAFEALVIDLIRERIVDPPCALLTGKLEPDQPLGMANIASGPGRAEKGVRQVYHGGRSADLLRALREAPWGEQDLAVWFKSLTWSNPGIGEVFEGDDAYNGDVVLYALRAPTKIDMFDAYGDGDAKTLRLATYFTLTGKSCPSDIGGSALERVLTRHFGKGVVSACSYS